LTPQCYISFSYDGAGNRVKREYKCTNPYDVVVIDRGSYTPRVTLYPNPTSGPVVVDFDQQFNRAIIRVISTENAALLQEIEATDNFRVHLDLGGYADGMYTIDIYASNE